MASAFRSHVLLCRLLLFDHLDVLVYLSIILLATYGFISRTNLALKKKYCFLREGI